MSVISTVLIPIIKLWLRSQVEAIQNLEINVEGSSRQILQGNILQATVSAEHIIYEGLHVSGINLKANEIHLNIAQILKGESLKLLQPIAVCMDATLEASDFQQCLSSPVFLEAIHKTEAPEAKTDAEIRALIEILVDKLGDDFTLEELTIESGNCHCRGSFAIAAT
ncbi:DUF2993 domain-containing protein [Tumidithrix elongata RA019]|uniref:DUF2993 domain-containing protein n=1 Tax=Tumidithrix elongata BACA0141 TaxID=2716417 RepID=A0AAW9Q1W6_9CYAN|nr:DUF2993 domain-containing protein [Tumidithrix elongata RA019]